MIVSDQVDPGTEAQLSEFQMIIEQMEKNWPPRAAARPPAAAAPAQEQRVHKKSHRGIDEDLKLILDNMDPELMAPMEGSPKGVKVGATPFIPSAKG